LALIYIDRLIQRNNFLLTDLNVHRVVITAILLAAKFFDDAYYNNAYYAKVGGVLVSEMNGLEVDFLFRINFSLHVTPELFQKYREELVSHSRGPSVQGLSAQHMPMPVAPVIMQAAPQSHNAVIHHHPVQMQASVNSNSSRSIPPPQHNSQYGNERQYITPSPPDSSAMAAWVHPNGTELMGSVSSGGLAAAMQASLETTTGVHTTLNYTANASVASYPVQQHWRRSPQPNYDGTSMGPVTIPVPNHGEQYVVYDNVGYPYGTTLIHHNHAVKTEMSHGLHPHNGYSHHHHRQEPVFIAVVPESNQYFMSGHMITGTSGS
jgi:hypothetical protein